MCGVCSWHSATTVLFGVCGGWRKFSGSVLRMHWTGKCCFFFMDLWVLWMNVLEDLGNSNPEGCKKHIWTCLSPGQETMQRDYQLRPGWTYIMYTRYPGLSWFWAFHMYSCSCPAVGKEQGHSLRRGVNSTKGKFLPPVILGGRLPWGRNWELRMQDFGMTGQFHSLSVLRKLHLFYRERCGPRKPRRWCWVGPCHVEEIGADQIGGPLRSPGYQLGSVGSEKTQSRSWVFLCFTLLPWSPKFWQLLLEAVPGFCYIWCIEKGPWSCLGLSGSEEASGGHSGGSHPQRMAMPRGCGDHWRSWRGRTRRVRSEAV